MRYFLAEECVLKWLEVPSIYDIKSDELYEVDEAAFEFLKACAAAEGCEARDRDGGFIGYAVDEGIIKPEPVHVERPPVEKSPEPSLRYLELQITTACNLSCGHCYLGAPDKAELSLAEIASVLDQFGKMQGLRILITGGEPLLHSRFADVNDLLPGYAFRKVLLTNGMLLRRESIKSLKVDEVQVSIDGLEAGHEALRGRGTFSRAISALEVALDAGLDVSVSTMVHAMNLSEFDGMERLFRMMGVKDWSVDVPCTEGNMKDNVRFALPPEVGGSYLGYGFGEGLHGGDEGFGCGLHLAAVTARGKVSKCLFYGSSPVGDLNEGLGICWSRVKPIRLDELECDCALRDECRGGCRYRAGLFGNSLGKDLCRCAAYGIQPGGEITAKSSHAKGRGRERKL
jgi:radical SAM protein with 4Fe4S-binding SPASM domain